MAESSGNNASVTTVTKPTVFRTTEYSPIHTALALAVWPGAIHVSLWLFLTAFLLLPSRQGFALLGLLLFLMAVPVNGNHKWGPKMSRYVCKYVCGYFPITLHVEDMKAFDSNQAYVFAYAPHAVFPVGMVALLQFMPLPNIKLLASSVVFFPPFLRQVWTWIGFLPVTRKNIISCLGAGYSCLLVPGGVRETIYIRNDSEDVFLKSRKGFVRIAIEMGRPLVPVFCFAQNDAYMWWKPSGNWYARICSAITATPMLVWLIFGLPIPRRIPEHVFVGRPIELKKNPQPSVEEVDEIHAKFLAALEELFEKHKANAGHPNLRLRIH